MGKELGADKANLAARTTSLQAPSIWRRAAAIPYEGLLLVALLLVAAFPVAGLRGLTLTGIPHLVFQVYLFVIVAAYFIWFWQRGGQTLPMKTWRFKVVDSRGKSLTIARALLRFFCTLLFFGPAVAGLTLLFFPQRVSPVIAMWAFLPLLAGITWIWFDPDQQYLHDRLAGTRLIDADST